MNLVLFVFEIIVLYISLLIMYKRNKKEGLYIWALIASILGNIMILKTVEIFSFEVNLGIIINAVIFIAANIIVQKYGPEEIKKMIMIVLLGSLLGFIITSLGSYITPSEYNLSANKAYDYIFIENLRLYLANTIALFICLWVKAILYHELRKIKNKIWISNSLSTIIIQFIESIIFISIAYFFNLKINEIVILIIGRYFIKLFVGLIGNNAIYIANNIDK